MNPYFWLFALYAFFITPVRLRLDVRIGKALFWHLRVQVAGVEILRKRTETEVAVPSAKPDRLLWLGMWRQGALRPVLRALRLQALAVHAHFSFEDAAVNATLYAFARTLLETFHRCGALPPGTVGRLETDFQAQGTQLNVSGIFVSRLGTIGVAAAQFGLTVLRTRARLSLAEEETYAASD